MPPMPPKIVIIIDVAIAEGFVKAEKKGQIYVLLLLIFDKSQT